MKRALLLIALILVPMSSLGQTTGVISGYSNLGGAQVTTQGAQSANYAQGIIPAALITVYLTGTETLATIQTVSGGALSNPFYSNASSPQDTTNAGGWAFRATVNLGYDVVGSSGMGTPNCTQGLPLCYPAPVPLCVDCYPATSVVTPPSIQVAATAPILVNGGAGPVASGTATVSCPSCSNIGSDFLQSVVPAASGQNVWVFPSVATPTTGGTGPCPVGGPEPTGSVSALAAGGASGTPLSNASALITNGPCGNTISNNSWGEVFSGFSLPSYVTAADVSAVYAVAVSSSVNQPGTVLFGPTQFTCTDAGSSQGLYPSPTNSNTSYPLQQTILSTTLTGSEIASATCTVTTSRSVSITNEAVINLTFIALDVFYTGSAPPTAAGVTVEPPLGYDSSTETLFLDPNFPPDLAPITVGQLLALNTALLPLGARYAIRDGTSTSDCATGGGSSSVWCVWNGSGFVAFGPFPGAGVAVATSSGWGTSLTKIGTDTGSPTAGTLSGTGSPVCVDSNGGIATQDCSQPIVASFVGTLANSQIIFYVQSAVAVTVPSSCSGSKLHAAVAATSSAAITLTDLTTSTLLCTATFAGSGVSATWSGSGGSVSIGDILEFAGPSTADATLATIGGMILVTR